MTSDKFWIIWSPGSHKPPTVKFWTEAEAIGVAEKMALRHTGNEFIVMESRVGVARSKKVEKVAYSRKRKKSKTAEKKEVEIWRTYSEWKQNGYQVMGGQRGTLMEGENKFSRKQVTPMVGYYSGFDVLDIK